MEKKQIAIAVVAILLGFSLAWTAALSKKAFVEKGEITESDDAAWELYYDPYATFYHDRWILITAGRYQARVTFDRPIKIEGMENVRAIDVYPMSQTPYPQDPYVH